MCMVRCCKAVPFIVRLCRVRRWLCVVMPFFKKSVNLEDEKRHSGEHQALIYPPAEGIEH